MSWVNLMAFKGHGVGKPGNLVCPELEKKLQDNSKEQEDLRFVTFYLTSGI